MFKATKRTLIALAVIVSASTPSAAYARFDLNPLPPATMSGQTQTANSPLVAAAQARRHCAGTRTSVRVKTPTQSTLPPPSKNRPSKSQQQKPRPVRRTPGLRRTRPRRSRPHFSGATRRSARRECSCCSPPRAWPQSPAGAGITAQRPADASTTRTKSVTSDTHRHIGDHKQTGGVVMRLTARSRIIGTLAVALIAAALAPGASADYGVTHQEAAALAQQSGQSASTTTGIRPNPGQQRITQPDSVGPPILPVTRTGELAAINRAHEQREAARFYSLPQGAPYSSAAFNAYATLAHPVAASTRPSRRPTMGLTMALPRSARGSPRRSS